MSALRSWQPAALSNAFLAAGGAILLLVGIRTPPLIAPLLQPCGVWGLFSLKPRLVSLLGRCSAAAPLSAACIPAGCFGTAG